MNYDSINSLSSIIGRNRPSFNQKNDSKTHDSIRLMLKVESNRVVLLPVGNDLKPLDLDKVKADNSPAFEVIHAMKLIFARQEEEFSWSGADVDTSSGLNLSEYGNLVAMLLDCSRLLVNERGEHLEVDLDLSSPVRYKVTQDEGANTLNFHGSFSLEDGTPIRGFLAPGLVLTDDAVRSVSEVGAGYAFAHVFVSDFKFFDLDTTLSMMLSAMDNVVAEVEGMKVRYGKSEIKEVPLIIFEKVDVDDSLFMRVGRRVGNLSSSLCERFRFSRVAIIEDKEIVVRRVKELEEDPQELVGSILRRTAGRGKASEIWEEDGLFVIPHEVASEFLFKHLSGLLNEFQLMGAEKLRDYKISAPKVGMKLKLSSGINFLEGSASVDIEGESFSISDLLSQYGKNRYVTLSDGTRAILDQKYMSRLERIFGGKRRGKGKKDEIKLSFFDLPEVMDLLDDSEMEAKPFKAYRKFFEGFNQLGEKRLVIKGLNAKLRDYQKEGVKWLSYLSDNKMGGCLADDMGLGKTVQTIALLCKKQSESELPSLIVMPRSLIFNWEEEFKKFAPEMDVYTHYGSARDFEVAMKHKVILTSYAVLRNEIEQFSKKEFHYVILDESQNIKNVGAQITKAVWLLKATHRLGISGTPIENNLSEIYSLFRFLNPDMFGSLDDFSARYAVPIQERHDEDAAADLRRKIFPFILRRLKTDVLTDLPDLTEQVLTVEMTPEQARFYEQRRRYFAQEVESHLNSGGENRAMRFELLQALSELRQIASVPEEKSDGRISSPKIELLADNVIQAVESGHKVVVFYNFLAGIELTATRLEKAGIGVAVMTGATSDRKRVVDRFQNSPDCQVMLMTVKTGGVGLNLTAADMVFVAEPWWNRAAEQQAIARLHRIGQKKAVNCYYMVTAGTIEEKIRQLQDQKAAIVDAVISADSLDGKQLTDEEISYLLNPVE